MPCWGNFTEWRFFPFKTVPLFSPDFRFFFFFPKFTKNCLFLQIFADFSSLLPFFGTFSTFLGVLFQYLIPPPWNTQNFIFFSLEYVICEWHTLEDIQRYGSNFYLWIRELWYVFLHKISIFCKLLTSSLIFFLQLKKYLNIILEINNNLWFLPFQTFYWNWFNNFFIYFFDVNHYTFAIK